MRTKQGLSNLASQFDMVSRTFLKYENGPKKFYELLRPLSAHTELPHIFGKKVITLLYIVLGNFFLQKCILFSRQTNTIIVKNGKHFFF